MGEPGSAPRAISTHFSLTAVSIKKAPAEICLRIVFYEYETICPNRKLSSARKPCQVQVLIAFDLVRTVVDNDEIIAAAGHFDERNRIAGIRQGQ
jgi:hypothetical protein